MGQTSTKYWEIVLVRFYIEQKNDLTFNNDVEMDCQDRFQKLFY